MGGMAYLADNSLAKLSDVVPDSTNDPGLRKVIDPAAPVIFMNDLRFTG